MVLPDVNTNFVFCFTAELGLKLSLQTLRTHKINQTSKTLTQRSMKGNNVQFCEYICIISFILQELDIESETIVLADDKEDVAPNDLSKHVPADKGRYVFYLFKHTFEGDYLESIGERELWCKQ